MIKSWVRLKVGRDLYAPPPSIDHRIGLKLCSDNDGCPPLLLIPRQAVIDAIPKFGMQKLYDSLQAFLLVPKYSLERGLAKTIFSDATDRVMYKCVGVRAARNSTGVLDYDKWTEGVAPIHWSRVIKMVRRAEFLFDAYAPQEVLEHIRMARELVPFNTMLAPPFDSASLRCPRTKYFGSIAFGCNVFLRCHTDNDFTFSMAHILLADHDSYKLDDDVVVYFCFPTLGVAIPMRPGDFLLFNAKIPHCISSRCDINHKIMCISMFLKTAVVGLNNNLIPLTPLQLELSKKYRDFSTCN